jgi:protein-disulfide isomerase
MKSAFLACAASAAALALTACGGNGNSSSGTSSGGAPINQAAADAANQAAAQVQPPANGDWTQVVVETPEGGYRMGKPDAPVKLLEYASISCPHCAEFSEAGHQPLTRDYVKSGQVSWEFRPFMLFPTDPGLFTLLRCQGPQPFFALTAQIYENQAEWSARLRALPQDRLQALSRMPAQQQAGELVKAIEMDQFFRRNGMPQSRIDQCLSDPAALQRLAEIQRVGQADGITGTPTFLINGVRAEAGTWSALEPKIKEALGQ